jgi:hypothetical protein
MAYMVQYFPELRRDVLDVDLDEDVDLTSIEANKLLVSVQRVVGKRGSHEYWRFPAQRQAYVPIEQGGVSLQHTFYRGKMLS